MMLTEKEKAELEKLWPIFLSAAARHKLSAYILAAVAWRESNFGLALDANGCGDNGHGRGIMQIDDRAHAAWIAATPNWRSPEVNILKGAEVLAESLAYCETKLKDSPGGALRAGIAGYNCGPGTAAIAYSNHGNADGVTTGRNYSTDVLAKSQVLQAVKL